MKQIERPDQRFAFFLGAGCSISSGIPAAGRLVRDQESLTDWLRKFRDVRSTETPDQKIDEWARRELSAWNIAAALKIGHPYKSWLFKLAAVVTNNADVSVLERWKVWQQVEASRFTS